MVTGAVLLIVCLVFVRNLFGFFFVSATAGLCMLLAAKARPSICQFATLFVSTQLGLSVFSRADYLFTENAGIVGGTVMPSDVAQLSDVLFLPYWFWGVRLRRHFIGGIVLRDTLLLWFNALIDVTFLGHVHLLTPRRVCIELRKPNAFLGQCAR